MLNVYFVLTKNIFIDLLRLLQIFSYIKKGLPVRPIF